MIGKNTDGGKVMNPIIPEEPSDIHQDIGNQIPGVEAEENLNSIIESIMSPVTIHHTHTEEDEDDFEAVMYDDETIDCVLPLHPADRQDSSVRYVDDKRRLVEPTLKVRATAVMNDHFINPIIAIVMALAVMASTAWATAGTAWRMRAHTLSHLILPATQA